MKVLLLSRYGRMGASSRYRSYQYLPYLAAQGIDVTVSPFLGDDYLRHFYAGRSFSPVRLLKAFTRRAFELIRARQFDLIWLEKEALPWLPAPLESLLLNRNIPYIVDYDDARFHVYDDHASPLVRWLFGNKIRRVIQGARMVIAGNPYLAGYAERAGARRVEILPTVVDLERYSVPPPPDNERFTIGWIGTPYTTAYLRALEPALQEVCSDGTAKLVAIGASPFQFENVPLEIRPWSESSEVTELQRIDVGIMPLPDSPFERGKNGLKLIQYMACARPVIGTPVGVNAELIRDGINGFQATTSDEWVRGLRKLKEDRALGQRMGQAGRQQVEEAYSLEVAAPKLMQMLSDASKR